MDEGGVAQGGFKEMQVLAQGLFGHSPWKGGEIFAGRRVGNAEVEEGRDARQRPKIQRRAGSPCPYPSLIGL